MGQLQQPVQTSVATSNSQGMYSWQDPQVYLKSLDTYFLFYYFRDGRHLMQLEAYIFC